MENALPFPTSCFEENGLFLRISPSVSRKNI